MRIDQRTAACAACDRRDLRETLPDIAEDSSEAAGRIRLKFLDSIEPLARLPVIDVAGEPGQFPWLTGQA